MVVEVEQLVNLAFGVPQEVDGPDEEDETTVKPPTLARAKKTPKAKKQAKNPPHNLP